MIVGRLMGGLGNQMFQYAAARRLALRHAVPLRLDLTWFGRVPERRYALDRFNLPVTVAGAAEVRAIRGPDERSVDRLVFRLGRRLGLGSWHLLSERFLAPVDPRVLEAPDRTYLDGYWQSERYFADVADRIRSDFSLEPAADTASRELEARIAEVTSVSIHVRRGDYVANPKTRQVHGVCGLDYYQRCIELLVSRVARPHFFLFSDDPTWTAKELRLDYPATLVSGRSGGEEHEDLRLMSRCRHHIIANSSFSWWGAWLHPRTDKLVYAPRRWVTDERVDTRDLLPEGWLAV